MLLYCIVGKLLKIIYLLYFSYLDRDHSDLVNLTMRYGNATPHRSMHFGTTIYSKLYRDNVIDCR